MRHYRYKWDEIRGDKFNDWGNTVYWFEVDESSHASRQIEEYERGVILKYDSSHPSDEYGFLADQLIEPIDKDFPITEISALEFQGMWETSEAFNQSNDDS